MTSHPKVKRKPGSARHQTPGRPVRLAEINKQFHHVIWQIFAAKLLLMATIIVGFAVGVIASNVVAKLGAAFLIVLAPLVCCVEVLLKSRSNSKNRRKSLVGALGYGIVTMFWLLAALTAPTLVCMFGIGAMLAHGTELAHQAIHKRGTGKRVYDKPISQVLCGITLISFEFFTWSHFRHHLFNGTEADRESFEYAYGKMKSQSRGQRLKGMFWHLTLSGHYVTAAKRMVLAARGSLRDRLLVEYADMSPRVASSVQREYRWHLLVVFVALALSLALQTTVVLKLWLVPVLIGWGPAHSLIETTEHWQCNVPSADVFQNTRSLNAGVFAKWFANYNCCHVGHHHDMSVPADSLPAYEAALARSNSFAYREESYPAFYARFFCHVWTGNPTA